MNSQSAFLMRVFGLPNAAAILCAISLASCGSPTGEAAEQVQVPPVEAAEVWMWVTSDNLDLRTCPSESCGVVGHLPLQGAVNVVEEKDGWARVTPYHDAWCFDGRSELVVSGNDECLDTNGIRGGRVAEWVRKDSLSDHRPADPAADEQGGELLVESSRSQATQTRQRGRAHADLKLVEGSDDYRIYKDAFVTTARKLIANRTCTRADFEEMGGWVKSTTTFRSEPVYFTYCGGMTISNRIYLNAKTGEIFR